jgi:hypothetical protein
MIEWYGVAHLRVKRNVRHPAAASAPSTPLPAEVTVTLPPLYGRPIARVGAVTNILRGNEGDIRPARGGDVRHHGLSPLPCYGDPNG